MATLPRYAEWNVVIAAHFFNETRAGRPVYLQLDADTLREIGLKLGCPADQAEAAFLTALRGKLNIHYPHPFVSLQVEAARWRASARRRDETPPFIALLGAFVLAASRMERDQERGVASTNYYDRLNAIIGYERGGQPPDFDAVTEFWNDLRAWLDDDHRGKRGFCTARSVGGFWYIGWPLSQCLLREADRRHLPEFFRAARIAPRSELDPDDVLGPLTRWCQQTSCPFPERTRQLVAEGTLDARLRIAALVADEARHWGGEAEEAGRHSAPLILQIELSRGGRLFQLRFIPRRPPGFPEGTFLAGHHRFTLTDAGVGEWYAPLPPENLDLAQALAHGLELRREGFALRWDAQPVIVAAFDPIELGHFVSRPQARLGERSLILCRVEYAGEVERLLTDHAAPGWYAAPGRVGLPPDWQVFLEVVLTSSALWVPDPLRSLVPAQQLSIVFDGGLRFDREAWLHGAEPIVRVARDAPADATVEVDGRPIVRSSAPFFDVDLSQLGLAPGPHQVSVAGRVRHFQTVRSGDYRHLHITSGASTLLGHRLLRQGHRYLATTPAPSAVPVAPAAGEVWVIGAVLQAEADDLPENLPQPVLLPAGARRYYLLGARPGMVVECRDPAGPAYACFRTRTPGLPFTVEPPFPAVWLVQVSWSGRFSLRRIGPSLPPEAAPWPGGDVPLWNRLIRKRYQRPPRGDDGALWTAYVAQTGRR